MGIPISIREFPHRSKSFYIECLEVHNQAFLEEILTDYAYTRFGNKAFIKGRLKTLVLAPGMKTTSQVLTCRALAAIAPLNLWFLLTCCFRAIIPSFGDFLKHLPLKGCCVGGCRGYLTVISYQLPVISYQDVIVNLLTGHCFKHFSCCRGLSGVLFQGSI